MRSKVTLAVRFPFLFGGTFIEAFGVEAVVGVLSVFPFLFGGTFIEARSSIRRPYLPAHFPSFSEGLSLRHTTCRKVAPMSNNISLPFRRDFH